MKPTIIKIAGVWHCYAYGTVEIGLGFTPRHAYRDWLEMNKVAP